MAVDEQKVRANGSHSDLVVRFRFTLKWKFNTWSAEIMPLLDAYSQSSAATNQDAEIISSLHAAQQFSWSLRSRASVGCYSRRNAVLVLRSYPLKTFIAYSQQWSTAVSAYLVHRNRI